MKKILILLTVLAGTVTGLAQTFDGFATTNSITGDDWLPVYKSNGKGGVNVSLVNPARMINDGVAVCYPDGTYKINGQVYQPKGSKTCGIQEAVNALPVGGFGTPGGGTIVLAPGTFMTADTIYMPSYQSNGFTLKFAGAGISASGIVMTNAIPHEVMRIDPAAIGNTNQIDFYMENLFMGSITNATTNILTLSGCRTDANFWGSIGDGYIRYCYFGWWYAMTNHYGNIQPDGWGGNFGKINLVGVNLRNNYGGDLSIEHNTFMACIPAVFDSDNSSFIYNTIMSAGVYAQNDWPSSSLLYCGYAVNLINSTPMWNSIHIQNIGFNHFVGNGTRPYLVTQNTQNTFIHDDYFEVGGAGAKLATTANVAIVGLRYDSAPTFYDVTNTVDWSKPFQSDTGLVRQITWQNLVNANFKFNPATAPTSVTVGTTAPDKWILQTNAADGSLMYIPTWKNH